MPCGYLPVISTANQETTIAKNAAMPMNMSAIQCGIRSSHFTSGSQRLYSSCRSNSTTASYGADGGPAPGLTGGVPPVGAIAPVAGPGASGAGGGAGVPDSIDPPCELPGPRRVSLAPGRCTSAYAPGS